MKGRAGGPLRLLAITEATQVGGAEICLSYLLEALAEDVQVAVAGTQPEVVSQITAARPGTDALALDSAGIRDVRRVIAAWKPRVVHVNRSHLLDGIGPTWAAVTSRGVAAVAVEHLPWSGLAGRRTLWQLRALNRLVDAHVAVGPRAARIVEARMRYPRGSVIAVPNGVPEAAWDPMPRPAPGVLVGGVGRLTEQKGFARLVEALEAVPDARLVLVGDGPDRPALEQAARDRGVADRLIVTGWVPDARRWMTALDVLAMPSRWEGLPLAILEAMHAGLPVVASDVGSVADAVLEGRTGFVVDPDDPDALTGRLRDLVASASLRREMGARARARAQQEFTSQAMARRYERVYREVAASASR